MLIVSPNLIIPAEEFELSFSRSSGKGGQNVNKVSTKALLKWNFKDSNAMPQAMKTRFRNQFATRINLLGEVVIQSDRYRSQLQNENDCFDKLLEMIKLVEFPPKARRKTKPSKAQKKKRLDSKRKNSEKKSERRKIY
jgi:ribosome-associated protein